MFFTTSEVASLPGDKVSDLCIKSCPAIKCFAKIFGLEVSLETNWKQQEFINMNLISIKSEQDLCNASLVTMKVVHFV
jgi:hypothetical protein